MAAPCSWSVIPCSLFTREDYKNGTVLRKIQSLQTDWVVLAGFLWLVPDTILANYPKRIINIHPALLPKYGGKGMYGDRVHKEVLANGDEESGISIHYVNEDFDSGEIIYQARFKIEKNDDLELVKFKGQQLEHQYFPKIIEQVLKKIKS